ncbi:MAG: fumarylacetoacetate hydrolase family protein [Cytophagales bacterium]|nr:fumarylacetoacetate hydrolase family protein [Cytophagales bacterium]
MKIICIGKNYPEHIKELASATPNSPVIFLKPDTALLTHNKPFYYPNFSNEIHHEVEIIVKIMSNGTNIEQDIANKYYSEIGVGIDFTARDLQRNLKANGLPWEISKAFNHSAPISKLLPKKMYGDIKNISFGLLKNGKSVQEGNTKDMIFDIDTIISYVSQFITLNTGDILFTGTPHGVSAVQKGDVLEAYIEGDKLLECKIY